jgi:hypothetical protein
MCDGPMAKSCKILWFVWNLKIDTGFELLQRHHATEGDAAHAYRIVSGVTYWNRTGRIYLVRKSRRGRRHSLPCCVCTSPYHIRPQRLICNMNPNGYGVLTNEPADMTVIRVAST